MRVLTLESSRPCCLFWPSQALNDPSELYPVGIQAMTGVERGFEAFSEGLSQRLFDTWMDADISSLNKIMTQCHSNLLVPGPPQSCQSRQGEQAQLETQLHPFLSDIPHATAPFVLRNPNHFLDLDEETVKIPRSHQPCHGRARSLKTLARFLTRAYIALTTSV